MSDPTQNPPEGNDRPPNEPPSTPPPPPPPPPGAQGAYGTGSAPPPPPSPGDWQQPGQMPPPGYQGMTGGAGQPADLWPRFAARLIDYVLLTVVNVLLGGVLVAGMLMGAVFWMNEGYTGFWGLPVNGQPWVFILGFILVLYTMAGWWRDVVRESVVKGDHKPVVKLGLRYGMILFIASEVMFFFAWFFAYFNAALFPVDVGIGMWPPEGIVTFDPWHLPLINTMILLTSGSTVTWAHHAILMGDRDGAIKGLLLTIALGLSFTAVQAYEYGHAYHALNLTELGPELRADLEARGFNCLTCVAALGFGDIPADAFRAAYELVAPGGWIAFNIRDQFLENGDSSGFSRLLERMFERGDLVEHARHRYRHRPQRPP